MGFCAKMFLLNYQNLYFAMKLILIINIEDADKYTFFSEVNES